MEGVFRFLSCPKFPLCNFEYLLRSWNQEISLLPSLISYLINIYDILYMFSFYSPFSLLFLALKIVFNRQSAGGGAAPPAEDFKSPYFLLFQKLQAVPELKPDSLPRTWPAL